LIIRQSTFFHHTLRQAPAEAETANHSLLLRAGLIDQLVSGVYSFLPAGWRVFRKIEQIIREEMDAAGGQELMLPVLHPIELWEASGRRQAMGPTLFVVTDRRDRELALGATHEEVITEVVKHRVQSYRDLPVRPYQIQTKFRDEPRPRGGLIRVRQFTMKDLYSFDADWEGLDVSYRAMRAAYQRIFDRCGVPTVPVLADSGAIGGKDSQEFLYLTEIGEDTVLLCPHCGYAANAERADFQKKTLPSEALLALEEVATPGVKTIAGLCAALDVPPERTAKAVFYLAGGEPTFVVVRGDHDVNEIKLRNVLKAAELRLMEDHEVRQAGLVAGSASPLGLRGVRIVADDVIPDSPNLVGGANKPDVHVKNVNYGRDWTADIVDDIALARAGDACAQCGTPLGERRGIEMGHVFKLGTLYSEKLDASYIDPDGNQKPFVMGCYGIGVERLMAAAVQANHDDKGITWPRSITPYDVHIVALNVDRDGVRDAAEQVASSLEAAGLDVWLDDREESAGVKFNDADLLGLPVRVTVSPRTLERGENEIRRRRDGETVFAAPGDAVSAVGGLLDQGA
jgi:prolyl-tRNA synthetase